MRLLLIGFSIAVVLIVGALVGPSFVDWNKYKDQIVTQVANTTGLEMTIDGDLSLSILPYPSVTIEGLTVIAPQKIKFENLVQLKSAEVSIALFPLLKKEIKVSSVTLVDPNIQIEIMADGTPSWTTDKLKNANNVSQAMPEELKAQAGAKSSHALESIALDKLTIENGRVNFIDHQTGASYSTQEINLSLSADSLKGPFNLYGSAIYNGKKIAVEAKTGRLPQVNESLKIQAVIALPEGDAQFSFNGVTSVKTPFDLQGQARLDINNPNKLAKMIDVDFGGSESVSLDGLLSANKNKIQYDDLKISLGSFVGNGNLKIENFKSQNPLDFNLSLKSNGTLKLDDWMPKNNDSKSKNKELSHAKELSTSKKSSSFIPQTLTLPIDLNADVKIDVASVEYQGNIIKGAFVDVNKNGPRTKAVIKALDLPGQSKIDGTVTVSYASSSKSQKTGQVTYSDPDVAYAVNGQVGQLASFIKAFAPDVDASALTKVYKTAQVNLNGKISGQVISLKDSTVKLDQTVIGIGGRYEVSNNARPKAIIDISAGEIDFDKIQQVQNPNAKQKLDGSNSKSTARKTNPQDALKPLQNFSLPLDLGFDISVQKARINQVDIKGIRLTGDLAGTRLNLKNLSVNDFSGATISLNGQIANLSDLSGLDLSFYTKASDIKKFANALKVDTSSLPNDLKALEATLKGKGTIKSLGFDANIKAMGGQLDAKGNALDLLGAPSYNNLSVGLKHPNLVKAIQVVSPDFKGQAGLSQPINFSSNASINGKKIDLTNMSVKLGKTDLDGNLKIDLSNKVSSVRGTIQAGEIALDDLLGAKKTSSSSVSQSSGNASSPKTVSARWSKNPIDLGFMNTVDIDVALSAGSITYGAWNFTKPTTALRIGNGQMTIKDMKAGVFGGQVSLSTEIKANPISIDITSNMDAIDLEKLVLALSGSSKLKSAGTVSFDLQAQATGNSAYDLINALNGNATLNGRDVTLKGFDLAKLARGLATEEKLAVSALSLVDGAMSGGQTKFDTVEGVYKITKGVVNIQSMSMDSAEAIIISTGNADLPKWFINVDNKITLKNVPDLDPFEVKIKGPLDKPSNTFGKNILEDYVQDKLKRKLVKELPDVLGSDVTDKLKKFGILPQDAPKTVPVPTPPTNENAVPVDEALPSDTLQPVAPEPEPVPKKIEKPEDAVRELLNSETPEEALGNVLKGLF